MKKVELVTRVKCQVTKEDIKKGRARSLYSCPIALALKRQLGVKKGVRVDGGGPDEISVRFRNGSKLILKENQPLAQEFINAFDTYEKVYAQTFALTFALQQPL